MILWPLQLSLSLFLCSADIVKKVVSKTFVVLQAFAMLQSNANMINNSKYNPIMNSLHCKAVKRHSLLQV